MLGGASWAQTGVGLTDLIELGMGYGEIVSVANGLTPASLLASVEQGIASDVVRRILIERLVRDRFLVEFDYDGEREGGFLGKDNTYALTYTGADDEMLKEITLGNKERSIDGVRALPVGGGSPDSYALRARAASPEARDAPASLAAGALLRYGSSVRRTRHFRGARQLVEERLLDVDYVKRRGYLLPDAGIEEESLRLVRSTRDAGDLLLEGRRFALLARDVDYKLDNVAGRIWLSRALGPTEELAITYELGGVSVGTPPLGSGAIVAETGLRADFTSAAFPGYFASDGEGTWLFLRREGLSSYWELKNVYYVEGLEGSVDPGPIDIRVVLTSGGLENASYQGVVARYTVEAERGCLSFEPRDARGFYPRPFPGLRPFTDPEAPVNPFAPGNPIYGGLGDPVSSASINTLVLRFTPRREEIFLDYEILEQSVRVRVDGVEIASGQFTVDYASGILSFRPGAVSPSSDIEVGYSVAVPTTEARELVAAVGLDLGVGPLSTRVFSTARLPLPAEEAPLFGEERPRSVAAGLEARLGLGASEGERGPAADATVGGAVMAGTANAYGLAVVADMESGTSTTVSTREERWMPGSRSLLLCLLDDPVELGARGPLFYQDYWKRSFPGGASLQAVAWDNSANPSWSYADKAGPYNTADAAPGRTDRALVLDFDLGPAASYVSAATVLGGQNLTGCDVLHMSLRGLALSGGSVRVYLELLRGYEEDLNANDTLEGETSVLQSGLPIVPQDGEPTVIGTDRDGRPDGRITSEDLNRNGLLDPVGPYALDEEEGVAVGLDGGPIAEIGIGEEEWRTVSVDIRSLAASHPRVFQETQVLRLTVVSASGGASARGKLLVGGIWFSSAPVRNLAPEYLSVEEVSARGDGRIGADALSLRYPKVYDSLHGSADFRAGGGHEERTLFLRLTAPLPDGEEAGVAEELAAPGALTPYGALVSYVFVPEAAWPPPSSASIRFEIESTPADLIAAVLPASSLREGWNELAMDLRFPRAVRLNGVPAGEAEVRGSGSILSAVRAFRFSIEARGAEVPEGFELWLDEWHLAETLLAVDTALYADASLGYRGAALAVPIGRDGARSLTMLGDAFLRGGYEQRTGRLADSPDLRSSSWWLGHDAALLGILDLRARIGGSSAAPASEPSVAGRAETSTWSCGLGIDTGLAWLPVLNHAYHSSVLRSTEVGLGESGYVDVELVRETRSVSFEERLLPGPGFTQSYLYARTWEYAKTEGARASETLALTEKHDAKLRIARDAGRLDASFLRDDRWTSGSPAYEPAPLASYVAALSAAFAPGERAIPSGSLSARSDRAALSLSLPRSGYLGLSAKTDFASRERDFDHLEDSRDADLTTSLSASVPVSPGGRGDLEITMSAVHALSATCAELPGELAEIELAGAAYPLLLRPPLYYVGFFGDAPRANALRAVGLLAGDEGLARRSNVKLTASSGLNVVLREAPWYLPSRVGLSLEGLTSRSGSAYAQSEQLVARAGKSLTIAVRDDARPIVASLDATYRHGRNYATKVISHGAASSVELDLPIFRHGGVRLDHAVSLSYERQRLEDERLELWPGGASEEPSTTARPDRTSVTSVAGLELWSDRPAEGARSQLLFRSLPSGGERLVLSGRIDLENSWVLTDPARAAAHTVVPIKVVLTQSMVFRQSDYLSLGLRLKGVAGAEDRVSATATTRVAALGFELEATAELRF